MNWADYAILAVLGISAVISLFRGFLREALSLAGWVAGFWVAIGFSGPLADLLIGQISVPSVRQAVAFLVLLVATLLVSALVLYVVGILVDKTGLSGTDRMLGIVFGLARGAVIVTLLVLAAGLTPLPQDPWWGESTLIRHFESAATEVRGWLPPDVATRIDYMAPGLLGSSGS